MEGLLSLPMGGVGATGEPTMIAVNFVGLDYTKRGGMRIRSWQAERDRLGGCGVAFAAGSLRWRSR